MLKRLVLAAFLVAAFSVCALAGEGSDTLGACKLMPELRYSYFETPMVNHDIGIGTNGTSEYFDWWARDHAATVGVTWGVIDNLDLYTFVGARICYTMEGRASIYPVDFKEVFEFGSGFTCGLGVRGTFWRSPNGFYVGGGTSVTYALTHGKRHLKIYEAGVLVWDSLSDEGYYFQEQNLAVVADLHAGWHIKNTGLTPYFGVEYRLNQAYVKARSIYIDGSDCTTFYEKYPVGVYVGLDHMIAERLYLNVEAHMINRWGGTATIGYVFDICGKPEPVPVAPAPAPVIEPKLEPMSKN